MITRREALLSLYGAWRLFLRDPRGMEWLDDSIDGYWKSFFCALIILPGYVLLRAFAPGELSGDAGFFRIFAVESITYVIGWVAWPLLMAYVAPLIDREDRYIGYIVAYNWASGPQIAVYLAVLAVQLTGIAPIGFMAVLSFAALVLVLSYHWYVLRIALDVSPIAAVGFVAGEFVLAQVIRGIGQGMLL